MADGRKQQLTLDITGRHETSHAAAQFSICEQTTGTAASIRARESLREAEISNPALARRHSAEAMEWKPAQGVPDNDGCYASSGWVWGGGEQICC